MFSCHLQQAEKEGNIALQGMFFLISNLNLNKIQVIYDLAALKDAFTFPRVEADIRDSFEKTALEDKPMLPNFSEIVL